MTAKQSSIWPLVSFLVASALQVGGVQNKLAAGVMWAVSALLLAGWVGFLLGRRKTPSEAAPPAKVEPMVSTSPAPSPKPVQAPPPEAPPEAAPKKRRPRHELTPEELAARVFANISIQEVGRRLALATTSLATKEAEKVFVGKWFTISGTVNDIDPGHESFRVQVRGEGFRALLVFPESCGSRLALGDHGHFIKAEGKFEYSNSPTSLVFYDCVLLYLSDSPPAALTT